MMFKKLRIANHQIYLLILSLLFLFGVGYRIWISVLAPQPFIFDQKEYHKIALDILGEKRYMYSATYRTSGYAMILSVIYQLFGKENSAAVAVVQAVADSSAGILIYFLTKKLTGKRKIAFLSSFLYILNPFTSGYVGVRLTEVMACFFVTLMFYLLARYWETDSWKGFCFLAFILGFIPQVRPGFVFFTAFLIGLILIQKMTRLKGLRGVKLFLLLTFFYFLPFSYNLIRNSIYYHELSLLTVDNVFIREFYISLLVDSEDRLEFIPPEVNWVYQEYSKGEFRKITEARYRQKTFDLLRTNPIGFMKSRLLKLWYVWEKHTIFPYQKIDSIIGQKIIYWGNILFLLTGLYGLSIFIKKRGTYFWFAKLTILFVVYISLVHALTITAGRFSLPSYGLICLFSALGISEMITLLSGNMLELNRKFVRWLAKRISK